MNEVRRCTPVFKCEAKHIPAIDVHSHYIDLGAFSVDFAYKFEIRLQMKCAFKDDNLNSKLQQIHDHVVCEAVYVEFQEDQE